MKTKNYTHPSRRSFRLAALLAAVMLMAMAAQTARAGTYKINVRDYLMDVGYVSIGGTGSADKTTADAGETVTLMATANSGYRFFTWVVGGFSNDVHIEASNMAITTFTMPAHDVTIYARFAVKNNEVTTSASPSTGGAVKVSLDNAKWVESLHAKVGETVYFTLNSNDGYKPYTCSVTSGGNQLETVGNSFTMPNGDVTVTGNFLENNTGSAQSYNLSVYANQSTSLSETYNGSGTASGPNQATQGALVTLTATPNNGSTFNHWQIYNPIIGNYFFSSDATMTFLMPAGNVSATAYFRSGTTATLNETNGFTSAVFDATKGQYANFSRDFTSSVASTVCLPFNYHTSQASGKFYVFAGVDKTTNPWTVTMVNSSYSSNKVTGMLTAGTPYMYVPSASATPTFGGTVKVSSASHTDASEMDGGTWQFIGNFESKTWADGDPELGTIYGFAAQPYEAPDNDGDGQPDYTVSPGQFVRAAAGASIAPFRAYLKYTPPAGARKRGAAEVLPDRMTVRLIDGDMPQDQTTAIGDAVRLMDNKAGAQWYSLDGRRLTAKPSKKGVYVNNGQKIVIK